MFITVIFADECTYRGGLPEGFDEIKPETGAVIPVGELVEGFDGDGIKLETKLGTGTVVSGSTFVFEDSVAGTP